MTCGSIKVLMIHLNVHSLDICFQFELFYNLNTSINRREVMFEHHYVMYTIEYYVM